MVKFKHCFILVHGKYQEIPHTQIFTSDSEFANRYFLPINNCLMEVSRSDYKQYYKGKRRQKYLREEAILHKEISYCALNIDEINGEEIIADQHCPSIDELIVEKIMIENLQNVLLLLDEEERELIQVLFFDNLSLRKWSQISGIPVMTIQDKKNKIISKLKKLMKI